MIRVQRDASQKPEGYDERAARWLAELRAEQALDPELTASKFWGKKREHFKEDAQALRQIFHDKCAFCESKLSHSQHPQVEHYRPKSVESFTDLMFEWDNLLLSCAVCNTKKGTKFPVEGGVPSLLHPCEEEPSEHLTFHGANVQPLTERGRKTVALVGLDRDELNRERAQRLLWVQLALAAYVQSPEEEDSVCLSILAWAVQSDAPWAGCARATILRVVPWQHLEAHLRSSSCVSLEAASAALMARVLGGQDSFW